MTRVSRPDPAQHPDRQLDQQLDQQDAARQAVEEERAAAHRLAATARSILACPAEIDLLVDGVATVLDEEVVGGFEVREVHGSPAFSCRTGSDLAVAAAAGRSALLTLASGLDGASCPERGDALVLAGRLEVLGEERCECCAGAHTLIGIRLDFALLTHGGDPHEVDRQHRVPLEHFGSPVHSLNRGFLQRTAEHANTHHQDELRRAVALGSATRMGDVVGVRLTALSPRGVVVAWVDTEGAHRTTLDFTRPARNPAELGDLLRRELSAGLG